MDCWPHAFAEISMRQFKVNIHKLSSFIFIIYSLIVLSISRMRGCYISLYLKRYIILYYIVCGLIVVHIQSFCVNCFVMQPSLKSVTVQSISEPIIHLLLVYIRIYNLSPIRALFFILTILVHTAMEKKA